MKIFDAYSNNIGALTCRLCFSFFFLGGIYSFVEKRFLLTVMILESFMTNVDHELVEDYCFFMVYWASTGSAQYVA